MQLQILTRTFKISRVASVVGCASLLLAASLSLGVCVGSAWSADSTDASLSTLEMKFFQHDYPKDTIDARLGRIEKMVFGESKTGSDQERLSNLMGSVPNPAPMADEDSAPAQPEQAAA